MPSTSSSQDSKQDTRLSHSDFVLEAFAIIAETGSYEQVTIDNLCRRLKVSKGSFYWHFKNRAAMIDSVVEAWSGRLHQNIYGDIEKDAKGNASASIRQIVTVWQTSNIAAIDRVMRNWACKDERVSEAVAKADLLILGYLKDKFIALGIDPIEAHRRARLLIAIGIAQPQLTHLPHPTSATEELAWAVNTLLPLNGD
ncbi:TetR/AcrR family transcriptional regulator [Spongiibacter nanhainus]|uniref:TetR/AcrR family transcriptional regulator n=1 Tax=Spongiibacter nanhainus TaxID=2794344 RepID=A0A7T4UQ91_9GAMM|nr:TetR/AcrR family transcriptional regulator [Spongiibacter nanhainus]QQD17918.1 TetR/AcrR family transcriptional regulator [Spongiibacter nanhainus]